MAHTWQTDILSVSEEDVWEYGNALRQLATDRFPHVNFTRLNRRISEKCPAATSLEEYVSKAAWYRQNILEKHLPKDFNVSTELRENINSMMTYRGYIKFL
jgi:hypothetical protein